MTPTIALFARFPAPGAAKTRLIPALGADGAARLHRRLVERTLATIRDSGLPFAVYCTGALLADFAAWLGPDVPLLEQGEGDLGARLARVAPPAILLGADVPGLTAGHLAAAAQAMSDQRVVIGPATDGGYYLLGFTRPATFLFHHMPWGTDSVLPETLARLASRAITPALLEPLGDCDRPQDLAQWPDLTA
jgi:rSAM/selenodomain-associated transferase 1